MSEIEVSIKKAMNGVDDFMKDIATVADFKKSELFEQRLRNVLEFEKQMLEFMTEKKTRRVYVLKIETHSHSPKDLVSFDTYYKFFSYEERSDAFLAARNLKNEGFAHVEVRDLKKLLEMSDEEFDALGNLPNCEYAKKFRETMRNK